MGYLRPEKASAQAALQDTRKPVAPALRATAYRGIDALEAGLRTGPGSTFRIRRPELRRVHNRSSTLTGAAAIFGHPAWRWRRLRTASTDSRRRTMGVVI